MDVESEGPADIVQLSSPKPVAGRRDARKVARQLRDMAWLPDVIVCSNARRTKQTMEVMSEVLLELGHVDVHYLGSLYTVAALDG